MPMASLLNISRRNHHQANTEDREKTMKAWKIDRLGGKLRFVDAPIPEARPGSVLIRVETQSLMSYLKPYVEGALKAYRAPEDFIPGVNAIGVIEAVGADVWRLKPGQRVVASSH